ncbi:RHS repeat-associated core domain-containing protein [Catellatospora citrea]|uniref:RHS repeat-associated core domain-containing protein n=1 Tax=Catellatospora citrea TaxID=53366 RepID=UPI0033E0BC49
MVLVASLLSVPAQAAPPWSPESAKTTPTARVLPGLNVRAPQNHVAPPTAAVKAPVWPSPASAEVDFAAGSPDKSAVDARGAVAGARGAGEMPIWVSRQVKTAGRGEAPLKARVEVLSQASAAAAGVKGLLVRVTRADGVPNAGRLRVGVDYGQFADAYGAGWGSRLRLSVIPNCAIAGRGCSAEVLPSTNDVGAGVVSADVDVPGATVETAQTKAQLAGDTATAQSGGVLLALSAGPSGGAGSFEASAMSGSSHWSVAGGTGGFSWQYPMRVPPSPAGPGPTIGIDYSSQALDGRTAASNNQSGPIGEGFAYDNGYIERRYKSCQDDKAGGNNSPNSHDLCWGGENAFLNLGSTSSELIKDSQGRWHAMAEDGSKVELIKNTAFGNGDTDGEYWKVTTTDGTVYWFGRHKLPGAAANSPVTNSVYTVPVAGNKLGEPCHSTSGFSASFCDQGWRWNLDYVEDKFGNTMTLWYTQEINYYARNLDADDPVRYVRGGYVSRIDYGGDNRDGTEFKTDTTKVQDPPARVEFLMADRCFSNCTAKTDPDAWPDTPWDQECKATDNNCLVITPTFWSGKRLTGIKTWIWDAVALAQNPVDEWALRQRFVDQGDGAGDGLWLDGITHKGLAGAVEVTLPEVTFAGIQRDNRVDLGHGDYSQPMKWWRVNSIITEIGEQIWVEYSAPECIADQVIPGALDNNRLRCYAVKWTPPGYASPVTDYFHKYVVTSVKQIDLVGGQPEMVTTYDYRNPDNLPLWRHDDADMFVRASEQSWSQWRGYPEVITTVGTGSDQMISKTLYFRGMHDDLKADGTKRVVNVQGLEGGPAVDHDQFAGTPREQITFLNGQVLSATVTDMWRSSPKATKTIGTQVFEARYVNTAATHSRSALDGGAFRRNSTVTDYDDATGLPVRVQGLGEAGTADDECSVTSYVPNPGDNVALRGLVSRMRSWLGGCGSEPTDPETITSDTLTLYDNLAYGVEPTAGNVTSVKAFNGIDGQGARVYQVQTTMAYDTSGRVRSSTNIRGEETRTEFTPGSGGPVTSIKTISPLGWESSVALHPAFGVVTSSSDVNGRVTVSAYDALGRTAAVWMPGRDKDNQTPSIAYEYKLRGVAGASYLITRSLNVNDAQIATYQIYDGLGRERQSQAPANGGGRLIADVFYDSAGRVWKKNGPVRQGVAPDPTVIAPVYDADVYAQTRTYFDGVGRATAQAFVSRNVEQWRTVTEYHGDHVMTTAAPGAYGTAVFTDSRGRTSEARQYRTRIPSGSDYDAVTYDYTDAGQLESVTDASGNRWGYEYDLTGRMIESSDPDKGLTQIGYNAYGDIETTTSHNRTVAYTYDRLGRVETVRDGSIAGPKRAEWVYDLPFKGATQKSIRYVGTDQYVTQLVKVNTWYQPEWIRLTVPAVEGKLAGTYDMKSTYKINGAPATVTLPAKGGLNAEILTYGYDSELGMPETLRTDYSGATYYVTDSTYDEYGRPTRTNRSTALSGAQVVQTGQDYDLVTGRVTRSFANASTKGYLNDVGYTYDNVGNPTKIDDNPIGGTRDTQCFSYDHQQRLTQAWTPVSYDCSPSPTAAAQIGGPAPYWQSWDFGAANDPIGRLGGRLKETDHLASGGLTTSYNYPQLGQAQPHRLDGTVTKNSGGVTVASANYTYWPDGATKTRPGPNGVQNLAWDPEGHLATVTDTGTYSYIYDTAGQRLISKDPQGKTLHLGSMDLRYTNSTDAVTATRYYSFSGEVVAQRTAAGLQWLTADHQGTQQTAISGDAAQIVTRRRQKPYGADRGSVPTWVNQRGFLGGQKDSTGLTHLGAREYDPAVGRFLSVDPLMGGPQQLHGYAYANNNPIAMSDPSGLAPCGMPGPIFKILELFGCSPAADYNGDGDLSAGEVAGGAVANECNQRAAANTSGGTGGAISRGIAPGMCARGGLAVSVLVDITVEVSGAGDLHRCVWENNAAGCAWTAFNLATMSLGRAATMLRAASQISIGTRVLNNLRKLRNAISSLKNSAAQIPKVISALMAAVKSGKIALSVAKSQIKSLRNALAVTKAKLATTIARLGGGGGPRITPKVTNYTTGVSGTRPARTFFTVQSPRSADRLLNNGGLPFPMEPNRAHFGPGVYAWDNLADAEGYLSRLRDGRGYNVVMLTFAVGEDALDAMNSAHVGSMADDAAEAFVGKYSSLYGDGLEHTFDYISRPTSIGTEHFFSARVFGSLNFL